MQILCFCIFRFIYLVDLKSKIQLQLNKIYVDFDWYYEKKGLTVMFDYANWYQQRKSIFKILGTENRLSHMSMEIQALAWGRQEKSWAGQT